MRNWPASVRSKFSTRRHESWQVYTICCLGWEYKFDALKREAMEILDTNKSIALKSQIFQQTDLNEMKV